MHMYFKLTLMIALDSHSPFLQHKFPYNEEYTHKIGNLTFLYSQTPLSNSSEYLFQVLILPYASRSLSELLICKRKVRAVSSFPDRQEVKYLNMVVVQVTKPNR